MPTPVLSSLVLFHPDYNRRLWLFTKSADTPFGAARGLMDVAIYRR